MLVFKFFCVLSGLLCMCVGVWWWGGGVRGEGTIIPSNTQGFFLALCLRVTLVSAHKWETGQIVKESTLTISLALSLSFLPCELGSLIPAFSAASFLLPVLPLLINCVGVELTLALAFCSPQCLHTQSPDPTLLAEASLPLSLSGAHTHPDWVAGHHLCCGYPWGTSPCVPGCGWELTLGPG